MQDTLNCTTQLIPGFTGLKWNRMLKHTPQRSKAHRRAPAGLLSPLPVQLRCWGHISMDFITKLPLGPTGNNAAFVMIDKLSKQAHFIPTKDTATAEDTARLFIDRIFSLHGMLLNLTCDQDPKFTSAFWKEVFRILGTSFNMSTADHPQTDSQSERTIQTLEEYLRNMVNYLQNDWESHLPLIEFTYNNSRATSTSLSPFEVMQGENPL